MSSLMDPKNYDLNSTSTRKNLPQPCPLLRVMQKQGSRMLQAVGGSMPVCCQFAMRMSSTLCWHLQTGSKVDLLGFPLISGGTTSFFSLASNQLSPGRACGYGCMNFFSVKLDRNFRSDLNTTNLRVLLLPSHS